jgi:hypothetical protein
LTVYAGQEFGCHDTKVSTKNGPEGPFRSGCSTLLARTRVGAFVVADKSDTRKSREGGNDDRNEFAVLHLEGAEFGLLDRRV